MNWCISTFTHDFSTKCKCWFNLKYAYIIYIQSLQSTRDFKCMCTCFRALIMALQSFRRNHRLLNVNYTNPGLIDLMELMNMMVLTKLEAATTSNLIAIFGEKC